MISWSSARTIIVIPKAITDATTRLTPAGQFWITYSACLIVCVYLLVQML